MFSAQTLWYKKYAIKCWWNGHLVDVTKDSILGDWRTLDGQLKARHLHDLFTNNALLRRFGFSSLRRISSIRIQKWDSTESRGGQPFFAHGPNFKCKYFLSSLSCIKNFFFPIEVFPPASTTVFKLTIRMQNPSFSLEMLTEAWGEFQPSKFNKNRVKIPSWNIYDF